MVGSNQEGSKHNGGKDDIKGADLEQIRGLIRDEGNRQAPLQAALFVSALAMTFLGVWIVERSPWLWIIVLIYLFVGVCSFALWIWWDKIRKMVGEEKKRKQEEGEGEGGASWKSLLKKMCAPYCKRSELSRIEKTLKVILEEVKKEKEAKKYEPTDVEKTVERIEKSIGEIDRRTKRDSRFVRGTFAWIAGATIGGIGLTVASPHWGTATGYLVDTHGQSPWHFEIFKLCLTPFGRVLIHPRAKPVEPCPSGYWRWWVPC